MPQFRWQAMTASGERIAGTLEAASEAEVARELRARGHYPLAAEAAAAGGLRALLAVELWPARVPRRDLAVLTHELATLLQAGLPLDRALAILGGLGETRRQHRLLAAVLARVRDGAALADALAAEPAFPRLYVAMVRSGEAGGQLEPTLQRLADYLTRAQAVREAVVSALVYPAMLLVTAVLSVLVILLFVLPQFEPLFQAAGKSLPLATRVVMELGHAVGRYGWLAALLALAAGLGLRAALRRPLLRRRWDAALLRLPLFGELLTRVEVERFSRSLGTLLANGVSLPSALAITRDLLSNSAIAAVVEASATRLREGGRLSQELAAGGLFPALTLDLVRVGEETGTLPEMLLRQAELYERALRHRIERLLALLVPGLTILLGLLVAGLIASLLAAVLSINELAR